MKHAWLYSGLPQVLKGENLSALGSQNWRGPQFLRPQYFTVGVCYSGKGKKEKKKQVIASIDQPRECRRPPTERLLYQLLKFSGPANDKVHGLQFQR